MNAALDKFLGEILCEYLRRKSLEVEAPLDYELSVTRDPSRGDLSTNLAFKLAKLTKARPALVADELVLLIQESLSKRTDIGFIEKIQVAGAGFINFSLTQNFLGEILFEVLTKDEKFGCSDFGQEKRVLLEFVSANPTGPLTIAHGRQAAIGDSLARILQATGHKVKKEYYLNDAGRQMRLLGASLWARYQQAQGLDVALPEEGYQGEYLKGIAQDLISLKKDSLLRESPENAVDFCRQFAGDTIMTGIREDMTSIQVVFDSYFNETTLYEKNAVDQTLNFLTDRGYLYEKEGALWFRSTDFGDDKDRVVKKSSGEYTYLAPDIAYHAQKFQRKYNWLVNLWGPDHHGYIPRLKAACQALGHDAGEIDIRIVQLTTLFRKGQPVRMSTRAGEFVTLKELVDEVGADATRFFFVMRKIESHLDFDLDLAKEKSQDNPVFYLQYAHARIASLIKVSGKPVPAKADAGLLSSKEETDLIKMISEFPKTLIKASEGLEPYRLADYLRELAACFHKFYSAHRVIGESAELTDARLVLSEAARIVLRNGLALLGISQPESM